MSDSIELCKQKMFQLKNDLVEGLKPYMDEDSKFMKEIILPEYTLEGYLDSIIESLPQASVTNNQLLENQSIKQSFNSFYDSLHSFDRLMKGYIDLYQKYKISAEEGKRDFYLFDDYIDLGKDRPKDHKTILSNFKILNVAILKELHNILDVAIPVVLSPYIFSVSTSTAASTNTSKPFKKPKLSLQERSLSIPELISTLDQSIPKVSYPHPKIIADIDLYFWGGKTSKEELLFKAVNYLETTYKKRIPEDAPIRKSLDSVIDRAIVFKASSDSSTHMGFYTDNLQAIKEIKDFLVSCERLYVDGLILQINSRVEQQPSNSPLSTPNPERPTSPDWSKMSETGISQKYPPSSPVSSRKGGVGESKSLSPVRKPKG